MRRAISVNLRKSTIQDIIRLQELLKSDAPILEFIAGLIEQQTANELRRILNARYL